MSKYLLDLIITIIISQFVSTLTIFYIIYILGLIATLVL